jgi:hypothetical protein
VSAVPLKADVTGFFEYKPNAPLDSLRGPKSTKVVKTIGPLKADVTGFLEYTPNQGHQATFGTPQPLLRIRPPRAALPNEARY